MNDNRTDNEWKKPELTTISSIGSTETILFGSVQESGRRDEEEFDE